MGLNLHNRSSKKLKMKDLTFDNGWVWVIYRIDDPGTPDEKWHLQGVADRKQLAIDLCLNETYLIGPVPMNTALPEGRITWIGAYFPLAPKNPSQPNKNE